MTTGRERVIAQKGDGFGNWYTNYEEGHSRYLEQ